MEAKYGIILLGEFHFWFSPFQECFYSAQNKWTPAIAGQNFESLCQCLPSRKHHVFDGCFSLLFKMFAVLQKCTLLFLSSAWILNCCDIFKVDTSNFWRSISAMRCWRQRSPPQDIWILVNFNYFENVSKNSIGLVAQVGILALCLQSFLLPGTKHVFHAKIGTVFGF